ncbi:MAG TPA: biopolymer transporter ExbD [Candidatus Omnitrophota bacterium]|nr:biopolymer transporter ExbD [Candidatus Omnitrophota bacterium]
MNFSSVRQNIPDRPAIQMAPLIDIVFLLLVFFMSASIFYQLETEINITVPTAETVSETKRAPGEIIINIRKDGTIVVNQRQLSREELREMLGRISKLYKSQPVIIRADRMTYHENVVGVLDICAGADIWNVSFATMREEDR